MLPQTTGKTTINYLKLTKISINFRKFLEISQWNFEIFMVIFHKLPVKLP